MPYVGNGTDDLSGVAMERKVHRRAVVRTAKAPTADRLREELSFSDSLVETAQAIVVVIDLDGRVVRFNSYAGQVTGWSSGSVIGRDWFHTFIPKRNRQGIRERFRASLEGPPAHGHVNPILTRDKQIRQVAWYDKVLRNAGGKPVALLAIGHDITERLEADAARRRDQQILDAFFDQALLGLLWVCPRGRVLRVNEAYLQLVGFSREECEGEPVSRLHAAPEDSQAMLDRLARQESLQHFRQKLRCKDGALREVLIDANGLWEKRRLVHSSWFIRDITPVVELERQILSISDREQQRLGQDLHDDLCQRLATTGYLCHALQRELAREKRPEAGRAEEIASLIQETTTLTRSLAAGLANIDLQEEGLHGALRHLLRRTRKTFGVACRLHYACLAPNLAPHELQLYRIVQEAVNNAIRHGRASRIDIRLRANVRGMRLAIRDNGVGIQPHGGRRSGMGIRIMRHRADLIGASLHIQKLPESGTEVVCRITQPSAAPRGRSKPS